MQIFELPSEFLDICKLEKVLIVKSLLFKKVTVIPRGKRAKITGTICNVPIDTGDIPNLLPWPTDRNRLVIVKVKWKVDHVVDM